MTKLAFFDPGAAILLVLFILINLFAPIKIKGRNIGHGDMNTVFSIVLIIYVIWRVYGI